MIAWALAVVAAAATVRLLVDAWRALQEGNTIDIVLSWGIVGVALLVTLMAVFVAICATKADA